MDCLALQTKILNEVDNHKFGDYLEDAAFVLFISSTQQKMILNGTWVPNLWFVTKMVEFCKHLQYPELASIILDSYISDQARLQNVEFVAKSRDSALKKKILTLIRKFKFEQDISELNELELINALPELTSPIGF